MQRNALTIVFVIACMKFVYFVTVLLATACSRKNTLPDCTPEAWQYTFQKGKTIIIDTLTITSDDTVYQRYAYHIKDGTNLVFEYTHQFEDCREIADDEQTAKIIFEIPAAATMVKWQDSTAFQQAKLFYYRIGAWGTPLEFMQSGELEGRQITGNRWHIKASLRRSSGNAVINFDHDFTL